MASGTDVYYKTRDVVRRLGHSETESCRVYKDWHIELRVGAGHVSVWTSDGLVFLTMLEKPVYYRAGVWEERLSRLHAGRPEATGTLELRELLRAQALAEMDALNGNGVTEVEDVKETTEETSEAENAIS